MPTFAALTTDGTRLVFTSNAEDPSRIAEWIHDRGFYLVNLTHTAPDKGIALQDGRPAVLVKGGISTIVLLPD